MRRLNRYRLTRPRKKTADGWEGDIGGKREARDSDSASGRSFPGPVFPEPSSLSQRGCCVHLFLLLLFFPPHSQRRFGRRAWIPGPLPRHPAANLHLRRSRRKITECALFLPRESGSCPPDLGVEPPSIRGSACVFVSLANHFFFSLCHVDGSLGDATSSRLRFHSRPAVAVDVACRRRSQS